MAENPSSVVSMFRGDTHVVVVTVTTRDASGVSAPLDLTGASAKLTVKARGTDTSNTLQKTGVVRSPATNGVVEFEILPSDTAGKTPSVYAYDVQVTMADARVFTVIRGNFELKEDITTS